MIKAVLIALTFGLSLSVHASENNASLVEQAFVDDLVNNHQFERNYVNAILAKAKISQPVLEAIARPWEAKPWHQYYPIFVTEKRLNKGVEFWNQYQSTLERAEKTFGVPAEIIVSIIGVETYYGSYTGKYGVLDSLYTLGFHYPPRSKFFKSELKELFLLSREENFNPTELMGSYAGAMGWGQFISSSYRHYAVDFDNDGVRDLLNNPVDAIGSVANYFKQHGWQANQPVAFKATLNEANTAHLITKGLKPTDSWHQLQAKGITINAGLQPNTKTKVFAFELEKGTEYWVGLSNFYCITRYNHSPLYAMAVFQLSQQMKLKKQQ